jgi:hypothetical protein
MANLRAQLSSLIAHVQARRPSVAAALRQHETDLLMIADPSTSDEARVAALLRAGEPTIGWALNTDWPTGSSLGEQRLQADLRLLRHAWALATDARLAPWYRQRAQATAYGIGLVIAAGLSPMEVPGGLDLHIWRACETRPYKGPCEDALCRICDEHDRARAAIQVRAAQQNSFPWGPVLGVAAAGLAVVALASLFDE